MKLKYTYTRGIGTRSYTEYYIVEVIKENDIYEVWLTKENSGFKWFCFGVEHLFTNSLDNLDTYCEIYEELIEKIKEL